MHDAIRRTVPIRPGTWKLNQTNRTQPNRTEPVARDDLRLEINTDCPVDRVTSNCTVNLRIFATVIELARSTKTTPPWSLLRDGSSLPCSPISIIEQDTVRYSRRKIIGRKWTPLRLIAEQESNESYWPQFAERENDFYAATGFRLNFSPHLTSSSFYHRYFFFPQPPSVFPSSSKRRGNSLSEARVCRRIIALRGVINRVPVGN